MSVSLTAVGMRHECKSEERRCSGVLVGDDRNAVDIYCTYLAYRYSVGGHPIEGSVEIPDKWETGR